MGVRGLAVCLLLALPATAAADPPQIGQPSRDSVWVPTPERMIRRMLQLADTAQDDLVLDLGSGGSSTGSSGSSTGGSTTK